jgi:hypothetical protein
MFKINSLIKASFGLIFFISFYVNAQGLNEVSKLINNGNYTEADKKIEILIKTKPKEALLAWFNLGISNYKQKKFPVAVQAFYKVASQNSSYKSAASYYLALSYFNLQMNEKSLAALEPITKDSAFYILGKELTEAINKRTDESLEEARIAYSDAEGETCLELLLDSIFVDHPDGRSLKQMCINEIDNVPENSNQNSASEILKGDGRQPNDNNFSIFADIKTGYDSNIYLSESNATGKAVYQVSLGADYIYKTDFDIGLGFNYEKSDVIDLANESFSELSVYAPLTLYFLNSDLAFEFFHNTSRDYIESVYSESGINTAYTYDFEHLTSVISLDLSQKKAIATSYDYLDGKYNSLRGDLIYNSKGFKMNIYLSVNSNDSGDILLTGGTLPYANKSLEAGLFIGYWLTEKIRTSFLYSNTTKNYTNLFSVNGVYRKDSVDYLKLKIDFNLSDIIKI